jgi:hypothetical protein
MKGDSGMRAWFNKRGIVLASLLVAGLSAQAGSAMSLPEPLGSARAELAAVTVDQAAVARHRALGRLKLDESSDGRYTRSARARRAARAWFCWNLKHTHDWAEGILAGRWSQDVMVAMFQSEIDAARTGCAWAK